MTFSTPASRVVFAFGTLLFIYGSLYGRYYRDSIDRQATNHALASSVAYFKAHPTEVQDAKLNEIFQQERTAWLKPTRIKRVGLDVACWMGLAMQGWSVVLGFIRRSRKHEALA